MLGAISRGDPILTQEEMLEKLHPLLLKQWQYHPRSINTIRLAELIVSLGKNLPLQKIEPALSIALNAASESRNAREMMVYAAQMLSEDPDSIYGNLAMAAGICAAGDYQESLPYFRKLPWDQDQILRAVAEAYIGSGNADAAEKPVLELLGKHPEDYELICDYVNMLFRKNLPERTDAVLDLLKQDSPTGKFWSLYIRCRKARVEGLAPEADELADGIIRLLETMDGTHPEVLFMKGYFLSARGNYQEAAKQYETYLSLYPERLEVLVNLSEIYAKLGNQSRAVMLAENACRLSPADPGAVRCRLRREREMTDSEEPEMPAGPE